MFETMTLDMWIALAILAFAILFFITEWLRVDAVALAVVVALMLTGLVDVGEALSGFSNPAVLTIAALFVVGGAVLQTGLAGDIGKRILQIAGKDPMRLMVVIMITVALLSAFMSDTGTVAVLLPAITSLALSAGISASKLLIPLAYGALLGGATTLIGTPPNIIVSDLLYEQGLEAFQFFDYTPIGLLLLAAGVLFMLLVGHRLMPDHKPSADVQRVATPEELLDLYRLPDNMFRLRVRRGSDLVGVRIADANLRQEFEVTILQVLSETQPGDKPQPIPVKADTILRVGDLLIVQGDTDSVAHTAAVYNLGVQPAAAEDEVGLVSNEVGIAEVLLPPRSSLVGKTVVDVRFGTRFHLTVLAIQRPGLQQKLSLKETRLRFGDTLLVQGPWSSIQALRKHRRDFVVMGQPEEMVAAHTRKRAPLALLILFGMLVLMVTNMVPVVTASMLAALMMVLTGCLRIEDAYEAVDWKSIVLVACMIPMSIALVNVGLVSLFAQGITESLGNLGPLVVLAGLYALTSLFTQVLSNTATTVLIAPIALAAAQEMGVQPYAFLMGVAISASMAFASPVASPVNTLVMGAGDYRFSDYVKVGLPLIVVTLMVSLLVLPLLWPF
jgi:di/tricarboxylate transporter